MIKRFATYLIGFAVILAMTLQSPAPRASVMQSQSEMSMADMDMSGMDMSHCQHPGGPCKGMTPACIDSMGCVVAVAIPTTTFVTPAPFEWGGVNYIAFSIAMAERTIRPELSPPIRHT